MKIKILLVLLPLLFLGLVSCKDNNSTSEKESKATTTKEKEIVPKVKNEVQVGEEKLVYKVSLGVLPDLAYKGEGMKVAKVHKDRPGFVGGLKDGDIITEINGKKIKDLIEYTRSLGIYKKGDSVEITIDRNGKTVKTKIVFD